MRVLCRRSRFFVSSSSRRRVKKEEPSRSRRSPSRASMRSTSRAFESVLATKKSSIIPWGKKNYFDRSRFETDLKRIQAFYADRGYPDARVTGFDVKLNDKQDAVELTVTDVGGRAGQGCRRRVRRLRRHSGRAPGRDEERAHRCKVGQPRDRQLVVATHELAVNELRDHGFPYAKVNTQEETGTDREGGDVEVRRRTGQDRLLRSGGSVRQPERRRRCDSPRAGLSSPAICIAGAWCRTPSGGCTAWSCSSSPTSSRSTRSSSRRKCRRGSRWRRASISA